MSPGKKSSDKPAGRHKKILSRQGSASGSTSASAYNPVSGTFHALESVASDPATPNQNGRFRSMDDPQDPSSLNGVGVEYDSVSNNSSCSGESEDQPLFNGKEKSGFTSLGTPPGLDGGVDKRDKIRWKNEKKHQRQKERRAQELKDKSTGYLMSRKLEVLAQQLVSMGFSSDSATMALILNEGHVEQSVSWLIEGGEGQMKDGWNAGGNLKIDISDELAQMTDIENKYRYTRAEIERAVVSCEGDLERAIALLHARNRSASPSTAEEQNVPPSGNDVPTHVKEQPPSPVLSEAKNICLSPAIHQQRKESNCPQRANGNSQACTFHIIERRPNEARSTRGPSRVSSRQAPSSLTNERGISHGRSPSIYIPTESQSCVTPITKPDSRTEGVSSQHKGRLETKSIQLVSRESSVSTQVPQPPRTSMPVSASIGWTHNASSPSTGPYSNPTSGNLSMNGETTVKQSPQNQDAAGVDSHGHYHPLLSTQLYGVAANWTSGSNVFMSSEASVSSSSSPLISASQSRTSPLTSIGLYTGWGSGSFGSSVDWSMGTMANCDYKNIDWSMAASPTNSFDSNGIWSLSSSLTSLKLLEGARPALSMAKEELQSTPWKVGLTDSNKAYNGWVGSRLNGHSSTGLQDKSQGDTGNISALSLHEWTSPFTGKDLFTLPYQAVSSLSR